MVYSGLCMLYCLRVVFALVMVVRVLHGWVSLIIAFELWEGFVDMQTNIPFLFEFLKKYFLLNSLILLQG